MDKDDKTRSENETGADSIVDNLNDNRDKCEANLRDQPSPLMIGRVIAGRYQLESLVGNGGMCDVYRAKDLLLESAEEDQPFVAIKILQDSLKNQPDAAKLLIKEAKKTQNLSHPNIIRVHDFGVDGSDYYLVMEWLDGQTLDEVLKGHRPHGLSLARSSTLIKQLISALKYAHENHVVHADLKPSNIMLMRNGQIKIFDFGVAQALSSLRADQYSIEPTPAPVALTGYTPIYASPERMKNVSPTISDDVFAFSCIVYELLSSKHAFGRKTAQEAWDLNLLPTKPRNASNACWKALRKGLSFHADERIGSIELLAQSLDGKNWKALGLTLALFSLVIGSGYGYYQQHIKLEQAKQKFTTLEQEISDNLQVMDSDPSYLVENLDTLSSAYHVQTLALLRKHQTEIITNYQFKISELLNEKNRAHPDYYSAQTLLEEATNLYPDSYSLALTTNNINQAWHRTTESLAHQINTRLEQGKYGEDGQDKSIFELYLELKTVKKEYPLKISDTAKKAYHKHFTQAYEQLDVITLTQLLKTADTFFVDDQELNALVTQGRSLKHSIEQMASYRQAIEDGIDAPFPTQAALQLYQSQFSELQQEIKRSTTVKKLDALTLDFDAIRQDFPAEFSYVSDTRHLIADKYLKFSDYLLKRKRTKRAQAVMKKAQKFMSSGNTSTQ
ncbi:serine/threonine-protein kinase [Vibrio sp. SCSIO 43136]|uniref:serine/threonine-protein kinase n=1 Tax=Vibrio sp. SCSIO 43136 TaxID=2819101 RepID=UPI002075DDFD|nr:serine/threonine-protein kinase [Vibrio sp. SCSIO 43136]USD67502.1 serine/threonine protein kinase [Vibrio sp. SCSIO 43136]